MKKLFEGFVLGIIIVACIFSYDRIVRQYINEEDSALVEKIKNAYDYSRVGLKEIEQKLNQYDKRDLEESPRLIKANVLLVNIKLQGAGSGTYITYKGKKYILTCAHLTTDQMRVLRVKTPQGFLHRLVEVKIDRKIDLALYRVADLKIPTVELADEYPKAGSKVYVVGNPDAVEDLITDGIVSLIEKDHYIVTNKIFFGNSGGSLIYKGKLVGVTNALIGMNSGNITVPYGVVINIMAINRFLEDI